MNLRNHSRFINLAWPVLAFCLMWIATPFTAQPAVRMFSLPGLAALQEVVPPAPADRTLTYWRVAGEPELKPLPVETGTSNLRPEVPAGKDKWGQVELKGETAATIIASSEPHFFLFVPDTAGVHPPLLVRLATKRGVRRVAAMVQKGQRGFAIAAEEIVKPRYRVLSRDAGIMYMEVWAREPLLPGEYAFVGSDLARIPTFRVVGSK